MGMPLRHDKEASVKANEAYYRAGTTVHRKNRLLPNHDLRSSDKIVDAETKPLDFENCAQLGMNSEGGLGVLTWLDFASYKWNQSWMDEFSSGLKGIECIGFLRHGMY
jgi:hypothetical protein